MSKGIIAIDIDDVLLESGAAIIADYNRRFGTSLPLSAFYGPHDAEAWAADDAATAIRRVDEYAQTAAFVDRAPMERVGDSLRQLAERYELHILTGRKDVVTELTKDWLQRHFPGVFSSVSFANMFNPGKERAKGEMCVELGASFLIDDHLGHAISAAEFGVRAVLFGEYPWNQADTLPAGVTRCVDWPAVVEHFDGIS